jgi:hypothetical protein
MDTQVLAVEIAWTTSFGTHLLTLKHKGHVVWEVELSALCLEMQPGLSRERGDKSSDHGRQESQESTVAIIFSSLPGLAEAGLVRERTQWVDVGEEVVDEEIQCLDVADGLGRDGRMGRGGGCGLAADVRRLLETATLDCFCMTVWGTTTATRTFECAGNI